MSTMLYKVGGEHVFDGVKYSYVIIEEHEINDYLTQGWRLTQAEAQIYEELQAEKKKEEKAKK